jgi:hypothetical protein
VLEINYLDYFEEPTYHYEKIPTSNEANPYSRPARVARKEGVRRVFLNRFTPEKVLRAINEGTKSEDREKIGLTVYYERSPYWHHGGIGGLTIEQFIKPFDELWKEINPHRERKEDVVKLDKSEYEDFLNFKKYQEQHKDNSHIQ